MDFRQGHTRRQFSYLATTMAMLIWITGCGKPSTVDEVASEDHEFSDPFAGESGTGNNNGNNNNNNSGNGGSSGFRTGHVHRVCGPARWENGYFIIRKNNTNSDYILISWLGSLHGYFKTPIPASAQYNFCATGNEADSTGSARRLKVLGMESTEGVISYQYKFCGEISFVGIASCNVSLEYLPGRTYCLSAANPALHRAIQGIPQGHRFYGCAYGNKLPKSGLHGDVFEIDAFALTE